MVCWKKFIPENTTSSYDLFKHTPQWSSEALPLLREKACYLPMDLSEQFPIGVFIISNNQWLSFPFFLLHLTQWIQQAVSGSRPSLALSLWQHALILLFKHFFRDRCPVSALETSVYYSREEEFQEKYHYNIRDRVFLITLVTAMHFWHASLLKCISFGLQPTLGCHFLCTWSEHCLRSGSIQIHGSVLPGTLGSSD